jgi:hypothetical protein
VRLLEVHLVLLAKLVLLPYSTVNSHLSPFPLRAIPA